MNLKAPGMRPMKFTRTSISKLKVVKERVWDYSKKSLRNSAHITH